MSVPIPEPLTRKDYDRKYNSSPKGVARRVGENDARRRRSIEQYLAKEFVSWDGEGFNDENGVHIYNLLACSDGVTLADSSGLDSLEIFEAMLASRDGVTHIGYGLSYDINMWLKDLDREFLEQIYKVGWTRWNGIYLSWRRGKSFTLRRKNQKFLIYDILPFFQKPFVKAMDEYFPNGWEARDQIIAEKANRGKFRIEDLETVADYNQAELRNTIALANELRSRLWSVNLRVSRWDGPGAIASALYRQYETKSYQGEIPLEVAKSGRHAYAGGRFEIIRKGHSETGAYQYDINSAYPSAARNIPCLAHGKWVHRKYPTTIANFGLYRIEIAEPVMHPTQPQPLWMRNKNGTVFFNEYVHGWYWSPEALVAKRLGGITIHESWEWRQECDHEPFAFIEPLYNKRAALKKAGDGAHIGIKLGLNSLYGKLAQQLGWNPDTGRIPPYHSLEWAGYITSHCRAQLYSAALEKPDDIIAFETDAVFSRVPLSVKVSNGLGLWEQTEYQSLTYFKSGMSFATLVDGSEIEKTRGINRGTLLRSDVITALEKDARGMDTILSAEQTRFVTLGQALHQDFSLWRKWITGPRKLGVPLTGKRIDLVTESPRKDIGDGWRETEPAYTETEFSYPYEIAWIEPSEMGYNGLTMMEVRNLMADEMDVELYG